MTIQQQSTFRRSGSSRSRDLLLDVDFAAGRRVGVESALRNAIRDGRLRYGDALPSSRSLANDLGIARATVVAAYDQLVAEGYVVGHRGSATTVAYSPADRSDGPSRAVLDDTTTASARSMAFHPGRPDLSGFPRRDWKAALRTVLDTAPDVDLDQPDRFGSPRLRESVAAYLGRTRATQANATDIVVTAGFISALSIVADHLRRSGHGRIVVEDPMLYWHRQLLEYLELEVIPVGVDSDGISLAGLEKVSEPIDAVLVCPARQYPLGMTMSARRRVDLVEWARDRDAWIIEDDYDGEFRYDGRPVGTLQGLAPDRVLHVGTTSKTLAPGLRLGWMAVPSPLLGPIAPAVMARGSVPVLDQLTLSAMIDRGYYDRQVRSMRARYRRRRTRVVDALEQLSDVVLSATPAGLSLCVEFVGDRREVDDLAVQAASIAAGVGVVALSRHYATALQSKPGVVVGFAAPPDHAFAANLERLCTVLDSAARV